MRLVELLCWVDAHCVIVWYDIGTVLHPLTIGAVDLVAAFFELKRN